MEQQILDTAKKAISEAIINQLTGYNSQLGKLCNNVIDANEQELYNLINDEFAALIKNDGFKDALREALNQKLAKILIGRMGGELEKQVNKLKANPETRAKVMTAISGVIEDACSGVR
ncbi:MAG: hypothetical protein KAI73_05170 [Rhodospirillaceae bacterium]|nr:hypothetical protein [Rhodospirillaceae bacterium]